MIELLVDDPGHLTAQLDALDIAENQVQRRAGRFLLAVGMIDQNFLEIGIDLREPTGGSCGGKAKHIA